MREPRHCEERSNEANQEGRKATGLLPASPLARGRNDGVA